jgi:hypothetical protein
MNFNNRAQDSGCLQGGGLLLCWQLLLERVLLLLLLPLLLLLLPAQVLWLQLGVQLIYWQPAVSCADSTDTQCALLQKQLLIEMTICHLDSSLGAVRPKVASPHICVTCTVHDVLHAMPRHGVQGTAEPCVYDQLQQCRSCYVAAAAAPNKPCCMVWCVKYR